MKFNKFSYLYFVLLLLHISVLIKEPESPLVSITKPTLLISLLGYYLQNGFKNLQYFEKLFAAGLLFSLIGDILLLRSDLFLAGLGSFLIAQLSYTFSFYRANMGVKGFVQKYPLISIPIILFSVGLILSLYPSLGNMTAPVVVYAAIISMMLLSAINRKGIASRDSFQFIFLGAVLFVLSDSILAINKFKTTFDYSSAMIMTTYGLAQYFFVWGMTIRKK